MLGKWLLTKACIIFAALNHGEGFPSPDPTLRPIFHVPADGSAGYIGDVNGLMFRRVPWDSKSDEGGLYHIFWQAKLPDDSKPNNVTGLYWGHSVSRDFVSWISLPPVFGPGAESGGAVQLSNGDIITLFNEIKGNGHWQARPLNRSDPFLKDWTFTMPNGDPCRTALNEKQGSKLPVCKPTPGIPGTDLNAPFMDGSGDGFWHVVANRPQGGGATGAAMIVKTKDFLEFSPETTLHEYKWTRCVSLPSQCGFGPYPRDPNMAKVPGTNPPVWVFYGMQKTCQCSGREFYALGSYDEHTKKFTPLDKHSDYANNVWDGGEGYASMHLHDPLHDGRLIIKHAIIEGDRDPSSCAKSSLSNTWIKERGWFGTLSLPRVVMLENFTRYYPKEQGTDIFLRTPPLPELSKLRNGSSRVSVPQIALQPGNVDTLAFQGRSFEVDAHFALPSKDSSTDGWDFGLQVLWRKPGDKVGTTEEFTRIGVRDGAEMAGVDLWDEVNGDSKVLSATDVANCRAACEAEDDCSAWTFTKKTSGGSCRFKQFAQHSLQQAANTGCWLPYQVNSTSGYKQPKAGGVRFLSMYVSRSSSSNVTGNCGKQACGFGHHEYSSTLRVLSNETSVRLHAFVDRSIIEAFGQDGRSVITARVYPDEGSTSLGAFAEGSTASLLYADAWTMTSAHASKLPNFDVIGNSVQTPEMQVAASQQTFI